MELHRPKEEKTPFVCQLTFTAAGGMYGDIVQVSDLDLFGKVCKKNIMLR